MVQELLNRDFQNAVRDTGRGPLVPVRVIGPVDLAGMVFDRPVSFSKVTFTQSLGLQGASFRAGVTFEDCTFEGGLSASGMTSGSRVRIYKCQFRKGDFPTDRALVLEDARLSGSLEIDRVEGCGLIRANSMHVDGDCRLDRITMEDPSGPEIEGEKLAITLSKLVCGGDVTLGTGIGAHESSPWDQPMRSHVVARGLVLVEKIGARGSVALSHMRVNRFSLANSSINGSLDVGPCHFGPELDEAPPPEETRISQLDFSKLMVRGGITFEANRASGQKPRICEELLVTLVNGLLSLDDCDCAGDVILDDLYVIGPGGGAWRDYLARFLDGDPNGGEVPQPPTESYISEAALSANRLRCAFLTLGSSSVAGSFSLVMAEIKGIFGAYRNIPDIPADHRPPWVVALGALPDIAGDLHLDGAQIRAQLALGCNSRCAGHAAFRLNGRLNANGTLLGSVLVDGDWQSPAYLGALDFIDSTITSYMRIIGTRIGQTREGTRPYLPTWFGCRIESCSFGNSLTFWRPTVRDGIEGPDGLGQEVIAWNGKCVATEVHGQFILRNCRVINDLDLTRLRVSPLEVQGETGTEKVEGGILLDETEVRGDLLFTSPQRMAGDPSVSVFVRRAAQDWLRREAEQVLQERAEGEGSLGHLAREDARARAGFLQMRRLQVTGDLDLSGLQIDGTLSEDNPMAPRGHVLAERLQVGSELLTIAEFEGRGIPASQSYLEVAGALRLNDARIAEAVLSRRSFPGEGRTLPERTARARRSGRHLRRALGLKAQPDDADGLGTADREGIDLEDAEIGHLTVKRDPACKDISAGFPVPVNLGGLQCQSWTFDTGQSDDGPGEEKALAENYILFLNNDETFHWDIYESVFDKLRNEGRSAAAARVYRRGNDRAHDEKMQHRPSFGDDFRQWLLGWGARSAENSWHAQAWHWVMWFLRGLLARLLDVVITLWHLLLHAFFRFALENGLSPRRLGWVIALLMLFSWSTVGVYREHYEMAPAARTLLALSQEEGTTEFARGIGYSLDSPQTLLPSEDDWSPWAGVWLTARHHIPLIGLAAREDFEPTDDIVLWPAIFAVTPEDWFLIMSLLNWLLWPIFLTFLLKRSFRES